MQSVERLLRAASANGSAAPPSCAAGLSAAPGAVLCSDVYATALGSLSQSHLCPSCCCRLPSLGFHLCCACPGVGRRPRWQPLPVAALPTASFSLPHPRPLMCLCHAPQVYVTGHGGEDFLKFQDKGELQSSALADAIHQARHSFLVSCPSCKQGDAGACCAGILERREGSRWCDAHACCAGHRHGLSVTWKKSGFAAPATYAAPEYAGLQTLLVSQGST